MLICQLTDLHIVPEGTLAYGRVPTNQMTACAIDRIRALSPEPDVVLVTGDLTNCGRPEEYRLLSEQLARLRQPVFVLPGNHDRRENLLDGLRQLLPGTLRGSKITYAVDEFPVRLVMLDTVVPGHGHGELDAVSLAWLDETLRSQPGKPTIIAMHHPPFLCGIEHMDEIALRDPEPFAQMIARNPQIERIICGHHHRPVIVRFAGTIASIAPSVAHQVKLNLTPGAAGMFVMEPPAFQLHRWTEETGLVSHTAYVDKFNGPYPFTMEPDYPGQIL